APGDRPAARAERRLREGRHDAAGRLSVPGRPGYADGRCLRRADRLRAPPPPLRVQQRVPRPPRVGWTGPERALAGRSAGRDRRAGGSSLDDRHAVPPGAEVAAESAAPAVPRLYRRRLRPAGRAPERRERPCRRPEAGKRRLSSGWTGRYDL